MIKALTKKLLSPTLIARLNNIRAKFDIHLIQIWLCALSLFAVGWKIFHRLMVLPSKLVSLRVATKFSSFQVMFRKIAVTYGNGHGIQDTGNKCHRIGWCWLRFRSAFERYSVFVQFQWFYVMLAINEISTCLNSHRFLVVFSIHWHRDLDWLLS